MSSAVAVQVTPRDPVIARDGRPFSAGLRMKSLDWFYPSVLAGSLRTLLGQLLGGFDDDLLLCDVAGGLPILLDANARAQRNTPQLFFPAPADAVARRTAAGAELYAARPALPRDGSGCDLPVDSLQPVMLSGSLKGEFKPLVVPRFWSTAMMEQWLLEPAFDTLGRSELFSPLPFSAWPAAFLDGPRKDTRMHVKMAPKRGTGEDEMLFQTIGLDVAGLRHHADREKTDCPSYNISLSVRIRAHAKYDSAAKALNTFGAFGGERRIVHWKSEKSFPTGWDCPDSIATTLRDSPTLIRMTLVTPGVFSRGWLPDWLDETELKGKPPSASGVCLRLVGACVERWKPISGWSLGKRSFGPKPVRRLVPAGAVYFFQVVSGAPADLIPAWMESVCDREQDQRDGFGLAIWGIWRRHP